MSAGSSLTSGSSSVTAAGSAIAVLDSSTDVDCGDSATWPASVAGGDSWATRGADSSRGHKTAANPPAANSTDPARTQVRIDREAAAAAGGAGDGVCAGAGAGESLVLLAACIERGGLERAAAMSSNAGELTALISIEGVVATEAVGWLGTSSAGGRISTMLPHFGQP